MTELGPERTITKSINRTKMARPIERTPVLEGRDAINFIKKYEEANSKNTGNLADRIAAKKSELEAIVQKLIK